MQVSGTHHRQCLAARGRSHPHIPRSGSDGKGKNFVPPPAILHHGYSPYPTTLIWNLACWSIWFSSKSAFLSFATPATRQAWLRLCGMPAQWQYPASLQASVVSWSLVAHGSSYPATHLTGASLLFFTWFMLGYYKT